jgi:type IV secretory pathway VirD2 relaxase
MSWIEAEAALDDALQGAVKRKGNNTKHLRSKAGRVAKGVPEVMVKIKSFGKGALSVKRHLQYISRNGEVELETDRGEILKGREEVNDFFKSWKEEMNNGGVYTNRRDTMHMILSMPEDTPPEGVRLAAREFAKKTFAGNHEYVFALHTDEPHPHVHITVKMLGFDGKRLHIDRDKPQEYRETFADALRDEGIEAEATPRSARGVQRKPENSVIRHITAGDARREPRESFVRSAKIIEGRDDLIAESRALAADPKPQPEPHVKGAQVSHAVARWSHAIEVLEASPADEDRQLAKSLQSFVDGKLVERKPTEREEIRAALLAGPGVVPSRAQAVESIRPSEAKQSRQAPIAPAPPASDGQATPGGRRDPSEPER